MYEKILIALDATEADQTILDHVSALARSFDSTLAIQLPLAMFPLLWFTSSKKMMGPHRNGWFLLATGWTSAVLITALDIYGLPDALHDAAAVFTRH